MAVLTVATHAQNDAIEYILENNGQGIDVYYWRRHGFVTKKPVLINVKFQ